MENTEFLELLDELFEVDPGTVQLESVLKDVPGWSSLTFVGLIALIDEEYGLAVPPTSILNCSTAGELASMIDSELSNARAA